MALTTGVPLDNQAPEFNFGELADLLSHMSTSQVELQMFFLGVVFGRSPNNVKEALVFYESAVVMIEHNPKFLNNNSMFDTVVKETLVFQLSRALPGKTNRDEFLGMIGTTPDPWVAQRVAQFKGKYKPNIPIDTFGTI